MTPMELTTALSRELAHQSDLAQAMDDPALARQARPFTCGCCGVDSRTRGLCWRCLALASLLVSPEMRADRLVPLLTLINEALDPTPPPPRGEGDQPGHGHGAGGGARREKPTVHQSNPFKRYVPEA